MCQHKFLLLIIFVKIVPQAHFYEIILINRNHKSDKLQQKIHETQLLKENHEINEKIRSLNIGELNNRNIMPNTIYFTHRNRWRVKSENTDLKQKKNAEHKEGLELLKGLFTKHKRIKRHDNHNASKQIKTHLHSYRHRKRSEEGEGSSSSLEKPHGRRANKNIYSKETEETEETEENMSNSKVINEMIHQLKKKSSRRKPNFTEEEDDSTKEIEQESSEETKEEVSDETKETEEEPSEDSEDSEETEEDASDETEENYSKPKTTNKRELSNDNYTNEGESMETKHTFNRRPIFRTSEPPININNNTVACIHFNQSYKNSQIVEFLDKRYDYASLCPDEGYFPDLNTCTAFHYCCNNSAIHYKCDYNYIYHPIKNTCENSRSNLCYNFNCRRKNNAYGSYRGKQQVYAYCENSKPVQIKQCKSGSVFIESIQTCMAMNTRRTTPLPTSIPSGNSRWTSHASPTRKRLRPRFPLRSSSTSPNGSFVQGSKLSTLPTFLKYPTKTLSIFSTFPLTTERSFQQQTTLPHLPMTTRDTSRFTEMVRSQTEPPFVPNLQRTSSEFVKRTQTNPSTPLVPITIPRVIWSTGSKQSNELYSNSTVNQDFWTSTSSPHSIPKAENTFTKHLPISATPLSWTTYVYPTTIKDIYLRSTSELTDQLLQRPIDITYFPNTEIDQKEQNNKTIKNKSENRDNNFSTTGFDEGENISGSIASIIKSTIHYPKVITNEPKDGGAITFTPKPIEDNTAKNQETMTNNVSTTLADDVVIQSNFNSWSSTFKETPLKTTDNSHFTKLYTPEIQSTLTDIATTSYSSIPNGDRLITNDFIYKISLPESTQSIKSDISHSALEEKSETTRRVPKITSAMTRGRTYSTPLSAIDNTTTMSIYYSTLKEIPRTKGTNTDSAISSVQKETIPTTRDLTYSSSIYSYVPTIFPSKSTKTEEPVINTSDISSVAKKTIPTTGDLTFGTPSEPIIYSSSMSSNTRTNSPSEHPRAEEPITNRSDMSSAERVTIPTTGDLTSGTPSVPIIYSSSISSNMQMNSSSEPLEAEKTATHSNISVTEENTKLTTRGITPSVPIIYSSSMSSNIRANFPSEATRTKGPFTNRSYMSSAERVTIPTTGDLTSGTPPALIIHSSSISSNMQMYSSSEVFEAEKTATHSNISVTEENTKLTTRDITSTTPPTTLTSSVIKEATTASDISLIEAQTISIISNPTLSTTQGTAKESDTVTNISSIEQGGSLLTNNSDSPTHSPVIETTSVADKESSHTSALGKETNTTEKFDTATTITSIEVETLMPNNDTVNTTPLVNIQTTSSLVHKSTSSLIKLETDAFTTEDNIIATNVSSFKLPKYNMSISTISSPITETTTKPNLPFTLAVLGTDASTTEGSHITANISSQDWETSLSKEIINTATNILPTSKSTNNLTTTTTPKPITKTTSIPGSLTSTVSTLETDFSTKEGPNTATNISSTSTLLLVNNSATTTTPSPITKTTSTSVTLTSTPSTIGTDFSSTEATNIATNISTAGRSTLLSTNYSATTTTTTYSLMTKTASSPDSLTSIVSTLETDFSTKEGPTSTTNGSSSRNSGLLPTNNSATTTTALPITNTTSTSDILTPTLSTSGTEFSTTEESNTSGNISSSRNSGLLPTNNSASTTEESNITTDLSSIGREIYLPTNNSTNPNYFEYSTTQETSSLTTSKNGTSMSTLDISTVQPILSSNSTSTSQYSSTKSPILSTIPNITEITTSNVHNMSNVSFSTPTISRSSDSESITTQSTASTMKISLYDISPTTLAPTTSEVITPVTDSPISPVETEPTPFSYNTYSTSPTTVLFTTIPTVSGDTSTTDSSPYGISSANEMEYPTTENSATTTVADTPGALLNALLDALNFVM